VIEKKDNTAPLTFRATPRVQELVNAYRRAQTTSSIPTTTLAVDTLVKIGFAAWKKSQEEKR
jgi:hypothetical protein